MDKKQIVVLAVAGLAIAGAGFYGGMTYAKAKSPVRFGQGLQNAQNLSGEQRQLFMQNGGSARSGGARQGLMGGNFVSGEIISKDEKSITVKMENGSTKIVFLADSTSIGKTTEGTAGDLEVGKNAVVTGPANNDGSITAQNIQLRPAPTQPAN